MEDLFTVSMTVQQRIGQDVKVRVYSANGVAPDQRTEDYALVVVQGEQPEDLRDWLRLALAAVVEAL